GELLERLAALGRDSLLDARINAAALERDLVLAGLVARAAQGQNVACLAVTVAGLGELHLCALTVEPGEAERPHPLAAVAHDQVEPAAVGMRAGFLEFNLVRIEPHFTFPL